MCGRWTIGVNSTRLSTSRRGGPWLLALLPLLALSVLLTACGGSTSSATPATTTPTTAPGQASTASSLSKYTQCLTSHGVPASADGLFGRRGTGSTSGTTVPGGTASTTPRTRPTIPAQYQPAFQACASLRPTGGFGGFGGGAVNSAQAAAYRNCLQIHGVKLPTPPTTTPGQTTTSRPPSSTGGGRGGFGQFANNPTFQAAQKACASLLPARAGSTSNTTAATGA